MYIPTEPQITSVFEVTEGINNLTIPYGYVFTLIAWYMTNVPHGRYRIYANNDPVSTNFLFKGNPLNWVYIPEEELVWDTLWHAGDGNLKVVVTNIAVMEELDYLIDPYPLDEPVVTDTEYYNKFLLAVRRREDDYVPEKVQRTIKSRCTLVSRNSVHCPFDPLTNKRMTRCLNWRRTDMMGKQCRDTLTYEEMNESTKQFCHQLLYADDCKCVNRHSTVDYQHAVKTQTHQDHDLCWYQPCKSGAYLIYNRQETVTCATKQLCSVEYNVNTETGNVKIDDNSVVCQIDDNIDDNIDAVVTEAISETSTTTVPTYTTTTVTQMPGQVAPVYIVVGDFVHSNTGHVVIGCACVSMVVVVSFLAYRHKHRYS